MLNSLITPSYQNHLTLTCCHDEKTNILNGFDNPILVNDLPSYTKREY